jgi:hypothetical protein
MNINQSDIETIIQFVDDALFSNLNGANYYDKCIAIKEDIRRRLLNCMDTATIEDHNKRAMELNFPNHVKGRKDEK